MLSLTPNLCEPQKSHASSTHARTYFFHNIPVLTAVEIQHTPHRLTPHAFCFAFAFITTEPREFNRYRDGLSGRGSIPGRDSDFSLLHNVQAASGAHQAPYSVGTGGFLIVGKADEA